VIPAAVLAALLAELAGQVAPLPQRRRRVPRKWLLWNKPVLTAAAFGAVIGAGVFTYLGHATMYALGAVVALSPSIGTAAFVGAVYGVARGATLLSTWIVDRYRGRSIPWTSLFAARKRVSRGLAMSAFVTFALALVLG
jgi:hypothetical protein